MNLEQLTSAVHNGLKRVSPKPPEECTTCAGYVTAAWLCRTLDLGDLVPPGSGITWTMAADTLDVLEGLVAQGKGDVSRDHEGRQVYRWRHHNCDHCGDSRTVSWADTGIFTTACPKCPKPCRKCKPEGHILRYCKDRPCACDCHKPRAPATPGTLLSSQDENQLALDADMLGGQLGSSIEDALAELDRLRVEVVRLTHKQKLGAGRDQEKENL